MLTPHIIKQAKTIEIKRRGPGKFVDGFHVKDPEQRFNIVGSVQPLTGMEILQVVEGDRSREHVRIFTTGDIAVDDTVIYNCREFEVQIVNDWENQGLQLTHRQARAVLKDVNKDGV